MKKVLFVFFAAGMLALVSCGPSAEELKAIEQARLDSILKVEADSLALVVEQTRLDSIKLADSLEVVRVNDSIAAAEAEKANKGSKKPVKIPVKDEKVPTTGKDGRRS